MRCADDGQGAGALRAECMIECSIHGDESDEGYACCCTPNVTIDMLASE